MSNTKARMRDVTIGLQTIMRNDTVEKYFTDIRMYPAYKSKDEEVELFTEYNKTKSKVIKDRIAQANLRFVISIAKMCYIKNNTLSIIDYIQWGNIGLVDAIDLFDVTKGFKFISYAVFHIRKEIYKNMNEFRRVRFPLNIIQLECKINKIGDKFLAKNEFSLTMFEIAEQLKDEHLIASDDFKYGMYSFAGDNSIDDNILGMEEMEIHETIEGEEDIPLTDKADNKYKWNQLLSILRIDYRIMVEMFYGIGRQAESIETIADAFECTRENARQHIARNVNKLKEHIKTTGICRDELV